MEEIRFYYPNNKKGQEGLYEVKPERKKHVESIKDRFDLKVYKIIQHFKGDILPDEHYIEIDKEIDKDLYGDLMEHIIFEFLLTEGFIPGGRYDQVNTTIESRMFTPILKAECPRCKLLLHCSQEEYGGFKIIKKECK